MTDPRTPPPEEDDLMPIPPARDRALAIVCVLGIIICLGMTVFELARAFDGAERAWLYTFEWPIFAGFIVWIWRRMQRRSAEETAQREEP